MSKVEARTKDWTARGAIPARVGPMDARELADWESLADQAPEPNIFHRPDLMKGADAVLVPGLRLLAARDGEGRLNAVFPLHEARAGLGVPVARLAAHDYGPVGTPLMRAGAEADAWGALLDVLSAERRSALLVPHFKEGTAAHAALIAAADARGVGVAVLTRWSRQSLVVPWVDREAGFRSRTLKRMAKRLAEHGRLDFESLTSPDDVKMGFEDFLALEAAGWKGVAGTAMLQDARVVAWARHAIHSQASKGRVRVERLRLDGRTIASSLYFIDGERAWGWKVSFDAAYAAASPGRLLLADVTRRLIAEGRPLIVDPLSGPNGTFSDSAWHTPIPMVDLLVGLNPLGYAAARADATGARLAYGLARKVWRGARGLLKR
jgi:CelD/BcsL family acetyltransferase involved in cellulose biosynthesis